MRSGSGGGAGGAGRGKGGKSRTGTAAAVAGTLGAGAGAPAAAAAPAAAQAAGGAPDYSRVRADGASNITPEAFARLEAAAPQAHQDTLLRAVDNVARTEPDGALLSVRQIRDEAARLGLRDKIAFDAAASRLVETDKLIMHYHDYPSSVTPEVRRGMVYVPEHNSSYGSLGGTFYIGIAKRRD